MKELIRALKRHPDLRESFIYYRYLRPNEPRYSDIELPSILKEILKKNGISHLYSHQAEAISRLRKGKNVLVATPTSSGKSLIFNIYTIEMILKDPSTKALYLFPLKALEQDQLKGLYEIITDIDNTLISVEIYDGDTPISKRKRIRANPPNILITNPDMLHMGILANHSSWKGFFEHLSLVVIDEVHVYRGIFGSHMAQILRRLRRICRYYGSDPRFIMLSGTIQNPQTFSRALIGEEADTINISGAPSSGQHFLFFNPVISSNFFSARLFVECIKRGFRTICFTQARKITELIYLWAMQLAPYMKDKISSYRAGFLPEERREIEKSLFRGRLLGVISTSALEMGIDIGYLDVCILVGYPGTIINTWQRTGRVGRKGNESLVVLVAKPDALDQYFMKNPHELFERPFESVILDPTNPYILKDHLSCAASELPLTSKDYSIWRYDLSHILKDMELEGRLICTIDTDTEPEWFSKKMRPHLKINIRTAGESYTIFDRKGHRPIGSIDSIRAFKECHPGAIYLHRGKNYIIEALDTEKKNIIAEETDFSYFTNAHTEKETEILEIQRERDVYQFTVKSGILKVTEKVVGYEKRALPGQELMGIYPLKLPPQIFETKGIWIEIPPHIQRHLESTGFHYMGAIHAIEHAAIGIFPLFSMCDRNDLGGISYTFHPQIKKGAIFLYDGYPGGVGLCEKAFEVVEELMSKTLEITEACECENGCPSCIHSPKCGSGNRPLDKKGAIETLKLLLGKIVPIVGTEQNYSQRKITTEGEKISDTWLNRIIYLDLETQRLAHEVGGWHNAHLMGVSVGVIYDSMDQRFYVFKEDEVDLLIRHLQKADLIVGFNIKRFDYKVLSAYTKLDLSDLNTFDILEYIYKKTGRRLSLDHLARETLNIKKWADGIQAVKWFREGDMKNLIRYCKEDVRITKELFHFGMTQGMLIYRDKYTQRRVRLPVNWNFKIKLI